jgi:hypothetical protein
MRALGAIGFASTDVHDGVAACRKFLGGLRLFGLWKSANSKAEKQKVFSQAL